MTTHLIRSSCRYASPCLLNWLHFGLLATLLAGLVGGWTDRVAAQLPTIELQTLSQSVAQIGSSFELTLHGSRTDELQAVHFSSPHVTAAVKAPAGSPASSAAASNGTFKTEIAAAAQPGVCDVRGQGRFGLSNPRRLWLTRQPVKINAGDHAQAALAVDLLPHTILLAHCQPQQRNFYQLQLEADQQLHLAVYAQQLDSRATPIVVLYDAAGRELARGRSRGDWPAEIAYRAPQASDVMVVVFDAIFQGGPDYPYALECELTRPEQAPSGLELDSLLRPRLSNSSLVDSGLVAPNVVAPAWRATRLESILVAAEKPQPTASAPAPATTTAPASSTELPLWVSQTFSEDRTPQLYDFAATAAQALTIDVRSHAAGQLTDPRLLLYRLLPAAAETSSSAQATDENTTAQSAGTSPSQQQLLEHDDPAAVGDAAVKINLRDPHLTWTAPADGLYRLELQDNESGIRPSEQTRFRLEVRPAQPHFELLAYPSYPTNQPAQSRPMELNLLAGGTAALKILVLRREGFDKAIEVNISGLPPGVEAHPVTIHPTQSETTLTLSCGDEAQLWCGPLQVTGVAAGDPSPPRLAHAATITWPAIPTYNAVQARPCQQLWLGVNSSDIAPLSVVLGSASILEVKAGEKLSIPVNVTRRGGGTGACVLRPQNLLSKVTVAELTIPADQTTGSCEVSVAADAPLGEFSLWLQNETKVKWRENPQALQRAEEQLSQLQTELASTTASEQQSSLTRAIQLLTPRVEELKTLTAEKELTVFLPSTTQRIRVIGQ